MKNKVSKYVAVVLVIVIAVCTVFMSACNKNTFSSEKNISVVTREDGSGTKSAFMEILGLKGKRDVSGVIVASGTAAVLTEVKGNRLAIAYESLGYVTDEVKILKIDGVEPSVEHIKDGSYQIARPLNVVYRVDTENDALTAAFLEFLASETAQNIIRTEGYVALQEQPASYHIIPDLSGAIAISGSTSLQPLMIQLAARFEVLQDKVSVTVSGGGSGTGYKNAQDGVSNFGMISEVFDESKAPDCTYYEVAKDGIAVIVNLENTINDISMDALKSIYNVEETEHVIKTWSDVAGESNDKS